MATAKTTSKTRQAQAAEPVNVLDAFEGDLIAASDLLGQYEDGAVYAKVVFSGVLASMLDAAEDDTPPLKADASKTAIRERRDGIRNRVLGYVLVKTGRSYTWASISDWIDSARVNATLPEALQVKVEDGKVSGTFSTWALRALGRVKDEDVRASLAEQLASEGLTGQTAVEDAVRQANGEDAPDPVEPKAVKVMVEAVVKRVNKAAPKTVGAASVLAGQIGEDEALALADFGRIVFAATPSDPAVEDKDARGRKRLTVFRAALEQLLFSDESALVMADEDGITEDDTH